MFKQNLTIALSLLALCAACSSAPKRDLVEGNWQVMVTHKGKPDMLCYAGATPQAHDPSRSGAAYLMATRRPSGKIEISASAGYSFRKGSKVDIIVDGTWHRLFYKDAIAWARNDADDKAIIEAMKKTQDDIKIQSVSQDGVTSVDLYSPDGFAAAIKRIRTLCP